MEKKMLFQIEGDCQAKVLNELYMTVCYSNSSKQRETAESLMAKMRLFLTEAGYQKFLESQERGKVKLKKHVKVLGGHLHYDHRDRVDSITTASKRTHQSILIKFIQE